MLHDLNDGVFHADELILAVRLLPSPEASALEELLGADVAEVVFCLVILLLLDGPEHLVLLEGLSVLQLVLLVELPAASLEGELRKVAQLLDVSLAEVVRTLELPELHDLTVREGCDLVDLDPLACARLLVLGCSDILKEFLLSLGEGIGQQIVGALVLCDVLADVAEVELDVDIVVLELCKIVLEVAHGVEEVARTLLYRVGHCEGLADVVTV